MKNKLLLFFIFVFSMNGFFVDKMKETQKKYLSINAAKEFYKLPFSDKMQAIKRNPGKSLLYGWLSCTLLHDSCSSLDEAFAKHAENCFLNNNNQNVNSFCKFIRRNRIIKVPFVFFGEFLHSLFSFPIKIILNKEELSDLFLWFNYQNCTKTNHVYYKYPTMAYSYRLYKYFFQKKSLEKSEEN